MRSRSMLWAIALVLISQMNIKLIGGIIALFCAFIGGYRYADVKAEGEFTSYKLEYQLKYNAILQDKLDQEAKYAEKIDELENERLKDIENLNNEHAKALANLKRSFKPSGVSKCTDGRQPTTKASGATELVCYRSDELQLRIAKSLAIGTQCDKLKLNYQTLLKLIDEYNNAVKRPEN